MSKSEQERRGSKRVDSKLQFKAALSGADGDVRLSSFETVNLSISGLYFKSDLPLEPMTRFDLEIMFPNGKGNAGEAGGPISVKGEGTVVWSAPDVDDPQGNRFEVGVYFSRLEPAGKKRLAAHVAGLG
jgi:hypothetical protein